MIFEPQAVSDIAHVIQLAIAPVFLLTGIGAMLNVLVNRLGRVVDRYRRLHDFAEGLSNEALSALRDEQDNLARRARMIHWAIGLSTLSSLLVCLVIIALFVGAMIEARLALLIAALFILSTLALSLGLLCFLREVKIARSTIHVVPR